MTSTVRQTLWHWSLLVVCGSWLGACASDVVVGGHDPTADDASETQQNPQDDARDIESMSPSDDDWRDGENKPFPPDDFGGPFPERDRPPMDDGFGDGTAFGEFRDAGLRLPDVDPTHGDGSFADDSFADDPFADRDDDSEALERDGFMEPDGMPGNGAAPGDATSAPGEIVADAGSVSDAQTDDANNP